MDLKEAIDRIEFEIEEDLRDKSFTIAGRMDIERIKQAKNELNTLNKGIDELIKKYEDNLSISSELLKVANDNENILGAIKDNANCINYQGFIQDLKKLKGE